VLRTYQYRLYLTNAQERAATYLLMQARDVYNAALEQRMTTYRETGQRVTYSRQYEHIGSQRRDFWHKTTAHLVKTYSVIALEDLSLEFMTRNSYLALSAHDAGLAMFCQLLTYKAEEAGTLVLTVNPANTSQLCSGCGKIVEKSLGVCVHNCPHCGLNLDRDINAAWNILSKALSEREPGRTERPEHNVGRWVMRGLGSRRL